MQESEALYCDLGAQKPRFPSPSSAPWGLPGPEASPVPLHLPQQKFQSSASNPCGLQESVFPIMDISLGKHAFEADVTYTAVEAFQPLPPVGPPVSLLSVHSFITQVDMKYRKEKGMSMPFSNHNRSLQMEPEAARCHAYP